MHVPHSCLPLQLVQRVSERYTFTLRAVELVAQVAAGRRREFKIGLTVADDTDTHRRWQSLVSHSLLQLLPPAAEECEAHGVTLHIRHCVSDLRHLGAYEVYPVDAEQLVADRNFSAQLRRASWNECQHVRPAKAEVAPKVNTRAPVNVH
eukprot:CAMPEP_0119407258 /NCGR_PEP_ID=MMETSP1335-20130426/1226_1 /TAXON_ID=259385 /ORGANISM="Chrysoculter rhomboideus, Strain RCC1486" /LENGTH=149 /DNA_ID=CAMNT_0007431355 /DNA_START=332 /DNA_END=780 /DNA_ORIENTATION=-